MRTVALPLLLLALVAVASAQTTTTYTTTADGCGAKDLRYCILNVVDDSGQPFQLTLDHRYNAQGPIDTLTVSYPYPGAQIFSVHGVYTLTACTSPAKTCYSTVSFVSDDGKVAGNFQTYVYWVGTCSGRACGPVVVGWHYRVLVGSTVTQQ
jgi:hypothetical protein